MDVLPHLDERPHTLTRDPGSGAGRITGDAALDALHEELASYPGVEAGLGAGPATAAGEIVVPLRGRDEESGELAFFSTIATFGTAVDITLAEVAVEAFYPANARTAMRLLGDVGATP